jgi:hypothetical protein
MDGWHEEVGVLDKVSPSRDLWPDVLERSRVSSPSSRRPTRKVAILAVAAVVTATAAGLGISSLVGKAPAHMTKSTARPGPGAGRLSAGSITLGANPFGQDGKSVTLSQLASDSTYAIPLPNSPLANSGNVGSAWENASTHAAVVYYPSSGIELWYGGTGVDLNSAPASEIKTIGSVQGLVVPAGTMTQFAEVDLPLPGNHLVTLYSSGPVSDLVSVATSISSVASG